MNVTNNCKTAEAVAASVSDVIHKGDLITTKEDVTLASNVINNVVGNISFNESNTSEEVANVRTVCVITYLDEVSHTTQCTI